MASSTSESDVSSSSEVENQGEDQRDHIKQIIAKGKQIAPFYDVDVQLWIGSYIGESI